MKTTHYRLCTLTQLTTQAILTTLKTTTACLILSLSLSVNNAVAQSDTCEFKSNPLTQTRCRTSTGGAINATYGQALSAMGGSIGDCYDGIGSKNTNKKRSVFLNGKLNNGGGFAMIQYQQDSTGTTVFFTNHNQEGSVFATDIDGDGTYEGEDDLISWLLQNQFDEINLYNIEHILNYGSTKIKSASSSLISNQPQVRKGWNPITPNLMCEEEMVEFHLFRFVHKAKSQGLKVNFVLSKDVSNAGSQEFYDYNLNAGGEDPQFPLREICEQYQEIMFPGFGKSNSEEDLSYISYEEATLLVLPRDSIGRISLLDKKLIDIYNFHVFNIRVQQGLITPSPQSCTGTISATGCLGTFDAILFEEEWWDRPDTIAWSNFNPDANLNQLKEVIDFTKCLANDMYATCEPEIYGVADKFTNSSWTNPQITYTEQDRANIVDEIFDRIYLYSYHTHPCDCYNGTQSSASNKFEHKVELFRDNNRGGIKNTSTGKKETEIYPVFHAEYYEPDTNNVYNWTKPRDYSIQGGTQTLGCDNSTSKCDFCTDYTGRFFNAWDSMMVMPNNPMCLSAPGRRLGFVENVFQNQYDLDPITSQASPEGPNNINGYCWYKSSTLQINQISGKKGYLGSEELAVEQGLKVFPNPANEYINVVYEYDKLREMLIYDTKGQIVYYSNSFDNQIQITHLESGMYFLACINYDNSVETQKFTKQ